MSEPKFRQFQNLESFTPAGDKVWTAEPPNTGSTATYVGFNSIDPLIAVSFSCWACKIDMNTGKIVSKEFTK